MLGAAALTWAVVAPDPNNLSAEDQQLYDRVSAATLTFTGNVKRMNDSNVASIKPEEDTMVVTVKKVESSNPAALKKFGALEGKELTVIANSTLRTGLAKGVSAVFFVDPLVYEKNIAVTAKAVTLSSEKDANEFAAKLSAAALRKSEAPLKSAVASADLIVTGEVKAIRPLASSKASALESSARGSGPELQRWKEAVVQVRTVEKDTSGGTTPGGEVVIIIPAMRDCLVEQPEQRIVIGLPGVWLLQENRIVSRQPNSLSPAAEFKGPSPQSYSARASADFQSDNPENLARIRRMLQEAKR